MMLLCTLFVAPAIYFLNSGGDNDKVMLWISVCFFGLGYPVGLFSILDRRPVVIINDVGIFDRTLSKKVINWDIIRDAYMVEMKKQKFICLVIDEKYEPSTEKGKLYKATVELNKEMGFQELNISASVLDVNPDKLLHLILQLKDSSSDERAEVVKLGM